MTNQESWDDMVQEWHHDSPVSATQPKDILLIVQRSSRRIVWMAVTASLIAVAVVASLTSIALVDHTILTFTFAVIGWSAFIPMVSYLLVYRRGLVADTLDSQSMLGNLLLKQRAKEKFLEFTRDLLGVETIMSSTFWAVSRLRLSKTAWEGGVAIFLFGSLFTGLVWRQMNKTRETIQTLSEVQNTLNEA
jgi:hypothetical protein